MKKKLTALTMLLATAMTAASCSSSDVKYTEVPSGDKQGQSVIYSLDTGNGKEYFTADDLLGELSDSSSAISSLYSEISRQVFTIYANKELTEDEKSTINKKAATQVDEFKSNAKSSAKDEGTDYDTYLETALAAEGVETLEELQALYVYKEMKSDVLEDYVEDHYDYFLQQYLTAYTPFQVKHILVAANSSDTKYKDGTMTADNARKLINVLNRFSAGDKFATIADLTDDTSSKDNGGIMPFNQAQNYVSEFRFAPYAIEIFGSKPNADATAEFESRYAKAAELHLINNDETSSDYVSKDEFKASNLYEIYGNGISTISLKDIMSLQDEITATDAGGYNYQYKEDGSQINAIPVTAAEQTYEMNVTKYNDEGELNAKYYEEYELKRNQIFNKTLNSHQVSYIEVEDNDLKSNQNTTTVYTKNGERKVLSDENGNPIFVALASTGIHFMCNVWNSYENKSKTVTVDNTSVNSNLDYFKLFDSSSTDYEVYKNSYIGQNEAYLSRSTLSTNSDSLLADITSYVSSLEYYVFNALVYDTNSELETGDKIEITFYDSTAANKLYGLIKDYVTDQITSTDDSFATSVQTAAETYGSKLAREAEVKASADNWYWGGTGNED